MKASRLRWVAATAVVCGSALIGVRLGMFLTQVMRAGDRPRPAAESPGRAAAARPNLRSGIAGLRPQFRSLNTAQFPLNGQIRLPVIEINPKDLPAKPHFLGPQHLGPGKSQSLPSFNYQITAYDDQIYTGTILGSDPSIPGNASTKIPVQIIPLIISVTSKDDGTIVTYDPTVPDTCAGGHTQVELVQNSPIFQKSQWTINGVNVGNTQYIDAFQRAEFWSLLKGKNYHLTLDDTLLPAQTLSFSGHNLSFTTPSCANAQLGLVDINDLDAALVNLITGPLAGTINPGTFPIFLMKNVVEYVAEPWFDNNCCVLGYHGAFLSGLQVQIYSPFVFETTGGFGPTILNTAVLSHEIGEAINDPTGGNPTPPWGNVGQQGGCQDNFEVGDPLTGTSMPPVVGKNGFTYNLQELAFIGWYYGGTAPTGAGGVYSSNGTFKGIAKPCPPGGTN
jgi:hypothetical protein